MLWYDSEMTNDNTAHPEPVIVAVFPTVGEAEIAQAKLRSFGIVAEIADNDGGGTLPVEGDGVVELEVAARDGDNAKEILGDATD